VANVQQEQFDFDFDARAYRYNLGKAARVENSSGSDFYTMSYGTGTLVVKDKAGVVVPDGLKGIPDDFDCITRNQDFYKYDPLLTGTIGGRGPNVSYDFRLLPIDIDDVISAGGKLKSGEIDWNYLIEQDDGNNPVITNGYTGYANEQIASQFRGYKRDEIYRFGIVGFNEKNQQSYVKWISDIKMPKMTDKTSYTTWVEDVPDSPSTINHTTFEIVNTIADTDEVKGLQLYARFNVQNMPSSVTRYQIVREERTSKDRTIVCQGMIGSVIVDKDGDYAPASSVFEGSGISASTQYKRHSDVENMSDVAVTKANQLAILWTPDISYNSFGNYNGVLNIIGDYRTPVSEVTTGRLLDERIKFPYCKKHIQYNQFNPSSISIATGGFAKKPLIVTDRYKHFLTNNTAPDEKTIHAQFGTSLIFTFNENEGLFEDNTLRAQIAANYPAPSFAEWDRASLMGEIKIDSPLQYGGKTYQKRQGRSYIETSDLIKRTDYGKEVNVFGGDSYVQMFEYLRHYTTSDTNHGYAFDNSWSVDKAQTSLCTVRVPVESYINLDTRAHQNYTSMAASNRVAVSEKAGYHYLQVGSDPAIEISQETGFYSYNSAYSKQNTVKKFYAKPAYEDKVSYSENNAIYISESATNLSVSDKWLSFLPDNSVNANGTHGIISSIHDLKDKLVFVQDNAIGYINIDPQTIIPTSEEELVLGSAKLFSKPIYITTDYGTRYQSSAIVSKQGLYIIDEIRKAIVFANGQAVDISRLKGMNSYLKKHLVDADAFGDIIDECKISSSVHNHKIYFSIDGEVFVYNELMQAFESILTKNDLFRSFTHKNKLIDIGRKDMSKVYIDGVGEYGTYFGSKEDVKLEFIVNANDLVKVFDTIEYNMSPLLTNLKEISIYENGVDVAFTGDADPRIRFKKLRANIPRVFQSYSQENTIGKNRYMNNNIHIALVFTNTDNQAFKLLDMITHYRVSSMPFN
jgi:hypothetical protein